MSTLKKMETVVPLWDLWTFAQTVRCYAYRADVASSRVYNFPRPAFIITSSVRQNKSHKQMNDSPC